MKPYANTHTAKRLENCPFCGCEITIHTWAINPDIVYGLHPDVPCFCRNYKIQESMFDAWNRRAPYKNLSEPCKDGEDGDGDA